MPPPSPIARARERSYPVADALVARGVPFVFATGYDAGVISHTPVCLREAYFTAMLTHLMLAEVER